MEKFKSFITEEKDEDYRLIVLSNKPEIKEYFHTAERLLKESKSLGIPAYVVFVESGKIADGKVYQSDSGFENATNSKNKIPLSHHSCPNEK